MTKPNDKPKQTPQDRVRAIFHDSKQESPMDRLPKAKSPVDQSIQQTAPMQSTPPAVPKTESAKEGFQIFPAFWTIASIFSMTVNLILIIVLLVVWQNIGGLSNLGPLGNGLLGGLYSNFERMDAAHIKTTIPLKQDIQLSTNIPVQTTTSITLANPVEIPNAHVKIATSSFNIDSDADVTLPAGTALNVILNFNLPLNQSVAVDSEVPADIALNKTDLHVAIIGLEDTIKPLYCMINPGALSVITNVPICHK